MKNFTREHKTKGFTLAELLIVVAIVAILVAVSIPIFSGQKEKAARATDIANARAIKASLSNMIFDGDIVFPDASEQSVIGIYIIVAKDANSFPSGYDKLSSSVFCGANTKIVIDGEESQSWNKENSKLRQLLNSAGIDVNKLKAESNSKTTVENINGWDWYIVEYTWVPATESYEFRTYSGLKDQHSGFDVTPTSTIEKYMKVI